MKIFLPFIKAYHDTYKLQKRYYVLTSLVGSTGVFVGLVLAIFAIVRLAMAVGMDLDRPILEQPSDLLWIVIFLVTLIVVMCSGVILVAALFSLVMICLGKFSLKEAAQYACLLGYPKSWFKKA